MKKFSFKWPSAISTNMLIIAVMSVALTTTSCKKEDDDSTPTTTKKTDDTPPTPQPADARGTLVAAQGSITQDVPGQGQIEIPFNTAIAIFYDDPAVQTYSNAGTVSCEGSDLTIQSGNIYNYIPSASDPFGLTFDSEIDWEVSGAGNVPTFTHSVTMGFPGLGNITSDSLVKSTADYVLTCDFVSGADSMIWILGGIVHTSGTSTSNTFTQAEIATLAKGQSFAQVVAYKMSSNEVSGKNYYYVNEQIVNRSVAID